MRNRDLHTYLGRYLGMQWSQAAFPGLSPHIRDELHPSYRRSYTSPAPSMGPLIKAAEERQKKKKKK